MAIFASSGETLFSPGAASIEKFVSDLRAKANVQINADALAKRLRALAGDGYRVVLAVFVVGYVVTNQIGYLIVQWLAYGERLSLTEAKLCDVLNGLDDCNLLAAGVLQDNVVFVLFLSSWGAVASSSATNISATRPR